ncbi:MAG TPA: alpha/beta fold hydrolase [Flavobacterium sp.]|nr:alpha/beta fold hydrolase [Flavobacterium sp.]
MKAVRFIVLSLTVLFGGIYLLYVSYIYFNQEEMVFIHSKLDKNYEFDFDNDFEEIQIQSFDNTKLHGLLFKTVNAKGLVFFLHGNAGALDSWGKIANIYTNLGYDIFMLDYRGFGKSEGEIEDSQQVLKDVDVAYQNISKRYSQKNKIVLGYSIGTGPAAYLASKYNPNQLILLAPYYNFNELAKERVPFFPDFLKKFDFPTNTYIKKTASDVFIFHGNEDHVIVVENAKKLQKLLKPNDKVFFLDDQGHLGMNDNEVYQKELELLLAKD